MKVEIENYIIGETIDFLFDANITNGRESRHRTRFIKRLSKHLEEVNEEQNELLKKYCKLDDQGSPKVSEEGGKTFYVFKDQESSRKYTEDYKELLDEKLIIDDSNSKEMLMSIRNVLDNYNGNLNGRKAIVYEHLCTIFKVDEEIEEEDTQ